MYVCMYTLWLLLIVAIKFSGLAHNLFLVDTNFGDCNPLYQEIVIEHTKFSNFDAPTKIAKFSSCN